MSKISIVLVLAVGLAGCSTTAVPRPPATTHQCPIGDPARQAPFPFSFFVNPVPAQLASCGVNGEAVTALRFQGSALGTVGAVTDITFPRLNVIMTFSREPCGGTGTRTGSESFANVRYQAQNDTAASCVARSRVDYAFIDPAGSTGFGPLLTVFGQQILLPALDGALLPAALSAQTGCPPTFGASSGSHVQCQGWTGL